VEVLSPSVLLLLLVLLLAVAPMENLSDPVEVLPLKDQLFHHQCRSEREW
jgi:hypothetical protein